MGRRMEGDTEGGYYGRDHFCPSTGVYIIADAGSNHCGDIELAKELIGDAAIADADAIKFQLFKWNDILKSPSQPTSKYDLPPEMLPVLYEEACQAGLDFLCTPFSPWAVEFLDPYVDAWKVGSFEAMRWDLYEQMDPDRRKQQRTKIISLGMCTNKQAEEVMTRFPDAIYMHCVSMYPTDLANAGLDRIRLMNTDFWGKRRPIGFSDHTTFPPAAATAALAMGCRTFERHIKCEDQRPSPDDGPWSIGPHDFINYVHALREVAASLDDVNWKPADPPPGRLVHGA